MKYTVEKQISEWEQIVTRVVVHIPNRISVIVYLFHHIHYNGFSYNLWHNKYNYLYLHNVFCQYT